MLRRRTRRERQAAQLARVLVALDEAAAQARPRPFRRAPRVSLRAS